MTPRVGGRGGLVRTGRTLTLYASLGCLGYLLTGLGTILPELRTEYRLPRGEAALYPSAFAAGLLVVGLGGHRMAGRLGGLALPTALASLVGGAVILVASGGRAGAGAGAVLLGLGGAGVIQLVPAALRAEHVQAESGTGTVAIGEANGVASAAALLAPLTIGLGVGHGLGWRTGFLVPPLLVGAVLLVVLGRDRRRAVAVARPGRAPEHGAAEAAEAADPTVPDKRDTADTLDAAPRAFWGWWIDLVLAVSIEFCVLFWCVDFLRTDKGLAAGTATLASAAFVLGMAAGRAAAGPVVRAAGGPVPIIVGAAGMALAGIIGFWAMPAPAPAVVSLLLSGLGVALLYPVIVAQALDVWTARPERAAARCTLASGVAIGAGPLLLGVLADTAGLRTAMLLAPLLLVFLLVRGVQRLGGRQRPA